MAIGPPEPSNIREVRYIDAFQKGKILQISKIIIRNQPGPMDLPLDFDPGMIFTEAELEERSLTPARFHQRMLMNMRNESGIEGPLPHELQMRLWHVFILLRRQLYIPGFSIQPFASHHTERASIFKHTFPYPE